ncbi:ATP-dependent DNA helicase tlh2 [Gracilariopsis chorda]|uniref:DNA 3'-5' helicase n=1 Tax=Gracilariopsis chorda TaxID=448386 RepID=A0A2V3ILS4_9FLOR|nr:ATP-dependent DNA helicase tlh2 [Gracilariopsis chorda]|eukprot:PXF43042.1 ATP-dependent DNA helicase tlh2 [Gracilariopsis chorda]
MYLRFGKHIHLYHMLRSLGLLQLHILLTGIFNSSLKSNRSILAHYFMRKILGTHSKGSKLIDPLPSTEMQVMISSDLENHFPPKGSICGDKPLAFGLQSMGLFIVCLECSCGLPSARAIQRHLQEIHGTTSDVAVDTAKLLLSKQTYMQSIMQKGSLWDKYDSAPSLRSGMESSNTQNAIRPLVILDHERQFLDPLHGLTILDGHSCPCCPSCYTDKRSLQKHLQCIHNVGTGHNLMEMVHRKGTIRLQTIFHGSLRRLFPVTSKPPIGEVTILHSLHANDSSDTQAISLKESKVQVSRAQISGREPFSKVHTGPAVVGQDEGAYFKECAENITKKFFGSCQDAVLINNGTKSLYNRMKSTFIVLSRFDNVLQKRGITMEEANTLTSLQLDSGGSNQIEDAVVGLVLQDSLQYLTQVASITVDIPFCVLRWLNIRDRSQGGALTVVEQNTAYKYAKLLARMVMFVKKSRDRVPSLCSAKVFSSGSDYMKVIRELASDVVARGKKISGIQYERVYYGHRDAERYETFRRLVKELLLVSQSIFASEDKLAVKNFVCCSSVLHKSGVIRFAEAWEITGTLAAIQYCVSVAAAHEYDHAKRLKNEGDQNGTCTEGKEVMCSSTFDEEDLIRNYVSLDRNSSASFVRHILDLAMSLVAKEDLDVSFENCTSHVNCGIVKEVHVSLGDIGLLVKRAHNELNELLHQNLLLGNPFPNSFLTTLHSLTDDLRCNAFGFSFLNHGNTCSWVQSNVLYLLQALKKPAQSVRYNPIVTSKHSASSNVFQPEEIGNFLSVQGVRMYKSRALSWLASCQRFQELLLFCVHISSGSPARAPELARLKVANDQYGPRNVFVSQCRVMLLTRWSKTRSLKGYSKPIPRFPDPTTSEILLLYLSLFRPLESVIIDALYGSDVASVHANRLFVNKGEPFKEDRIRSCISQRLIFKEKQLLFNDYRHFTAGMVPNVGFNQATGIMDEMQEELCNLGHLQAGHSKSTAERAYARTREVLQDITHSTLHRYREWSKTWHRLLDLDKNCRPRLQTGPRIGNALDFEAQEKEMPSPSAKRSKLAVDSPRHGILASSVKAETPCSAPSSANDMVVLPSDISLNYHNIKRSQTQSTAENGVTLFNGDDRNYDHLIGTFLNDLRQMFQDQKATFRTYTQFRVTIAIAERQNNTLVIMPTGSGKTICVMLPVFIERSLKSTIIIVPLVSLSTEYVERATSCRLSVQTGLGRRNQSEFADIYVVLPEHVPDPRFRELVLRLTNQKRLARIVVEEAHLVSMWSSFRQSLRDIKYGLMCIPTSIPRVLLTATLPPRDRMNLLL